MNLFTFTGPSSSGKTTLQKMCQIDYPQFEYIFDTTRPILELTNKVILDSEKVMLRQTMILAEHTRNSFLKNTILNRCIVDGFIYTQWFCREHKYLGWLDSYSVELFDRLFLTYDKFFYCSPVGVPHIDDGVRGEDNSFKQWTTDKFDQILTNYPGRVIRLEGSIEERYNKVRKVLG